MPSEGDPKEAVKELESSQKVDRESSNEKIMKNSTPNAKGELLIQTDETAVSDE